MNRYEVLLKKVRKEYPSFRVVRREESWLRPVFWVLKALTGTSYYGFVTTIGSKIYVGPGWWNDSDNLKYATLRHELVHIRQFHRWPFGARVPWLNYPLFSLAYLLVLPVLFTLRAHFEREGYTQTMLVQYELGGTITDKEMERNAERMVRIFSGSSYLWMARKKETYRWAMDVQRKINLNEITNPEDRVSDVEASKEVG